MRMTIIVLSGLLFTGFSSGVLAAKKKYPEMGLDASLAIMSVPFPMGKGVAAYIRPSPYYSISGGYQTSSLAFDLFSFKIAEFKESSLMGRFRFFPNGKSFNLFLGGGKRKFSAYFSKDLFDAVLLGPSEEASLINSYVVNLGLGNQWHWKKSLLFSVDWFNMSIPVYGDVGLSASRFAKDTTAARTIKNAENTLRWIPTGSFLTMSLGFHF